MVKTLSVLWITSHVFTNWYHSSFSSLHFSPVSSYPLFLFVSQGTLQETESSDGKLSGSCGSVCITLTAQHLNTPCVEDANEFSFGGFLLVPLIVIQHPSSQWVQQCHFWPQHTIGHKWIVHFENYRSGHKMSLSRSLASFFKVFIRLLFGVLCGCIQMIIVWEFVDGLGGTHLDLFALILCTN